MLNATEQSPLYEILGDVDSRGFFINAAEALREIQAATRLLISGGWVSIGLETRTPGGNIQALPVDNIEQIIAEPTVWDQPAAEVMYCLLATKQGVQSWRDGFPIVQISEEARRFLMFPQYPTKGGEH